MKNVFWSPKTYGCAVNEEKMAGGNYIRSFGRIARVEIVVNRLKVVRIVIQPAKMVSEGLLS